MINSNIKIKYMKWIKTEGEGSRKPEKAEQLFVKTKDGKKNTYFFTGSDISFICLREQYEYWLDEDFDANLDGYLEDRHKEDQSLSRYSRFNKKETGEVKPNSTTTSIQS